MSGVKHTPGSWTARRMHTGGFDILDERGRDVVTVYGGGVETESREANARLIAAAPDLLEALAEMEAACERIASERSPQVYGLMIEQGQSGNLLALDEARRASRAAIARARGEQSPNHSDQKEVGNG